VGGVLKMGYAVHWVGNGQDNIHGVFPTLEEAKQSVLDWWKKNDYEPYYIREWKSDNVTIWDYGSHTCFYEFHEVLI
jgi:hypothetical protein